MYPEPVKSLKIKVENTSTYFIANLFKCLNLDTFKFSKVNIYGSFISNDREWLNFWDVSKIAQIQF